MKNRIVFILLLITCNIYAQSLNNVTSSYTQSLEATSVLELKNDLTARRKNVKDINGIGCALIRVNIPTVNDVQFDKSVVGKPEYLPGEYNVFVPEHTKQLAFEANGVSYAIDFEKFGISIDDKKCYRVIFSNKKITNISKTKTTITANYDNVIVMIDGEPVGQTPLTIDDITLGKHIISVPNTSGVTMNDTIVKINSDNNIFLTLHTERRKSVCVDMATPGGDSYNWYYVFGTNVKEINGKKGVVDYAGNIIVPYKYDYIYPSMQNGYYVVSSNGKDGLYEPGKGLVVPCVYDGIITNKSYYHTDFMPVFKNGPNGYDSNLWGVLSPSGDLILPLEFNYVRCEKDAIRVYRDPGGRYGYEYENGLYTYDGHEITMQTKYRKTSRLRDGCFLFETRGGDIGFVDINGKETLIHCTTYEPYGLWGPDGSIGFCCGLLAVQDKKSGKLGYIDKHLKLVIPTVYDKAYEFESNINFNEQGVVLLKYKGDKVVLNSKGQRVISCFSKGFSDVKLVFPAEESWNKGRFSESSLYEPGDVNLIEVINTNGKIGLYDLKGRVVVPCKYAEEDIKWFYDNNKNYFVLDDKDKISIYDEKHKLLFSLPPNFSVIDITNGFIMVIDNGTKSYGYLNNKGEILANCIYGYYSEVETEINDNSEVIENGYDITQILDEKPISEGLAILAIGDRFGFIDNKGRIRVPLKYTAVTPFENGIAYVRDVKGKWKKILLKDL